MTLELKVARETVDGWVITGQSALETLTNTNARDRFKTRIAVKAGDVIGLYASTTSPIFDDSHGFGDGYFTNWRSGGDVLPGSPDLIGGGPEAGAVVVDARFELDADKDGFGDESEDKRKGKAGATNGCPPAKKKKRCKRHGGHRSASAAKRCKHGGRR